MDKMKQDDLRIRRTRKLLFHALLELMEKQAFETISVKQICDLAMVHRTTFYTHFQDKYDLLSSTIRQIAEEELPLAGKTLSPSESFQEILSVATKHHKLFSQLLNKERDSLSNILRRDMGEGIRKYLVENYAMEENSIELHIRTEAYIGAILGVLNWWLENNMSIDLETLMSKLGIVNEWDFLDNKYAVSMD